jgi:hypothetical protein
MHGPAPHLRQIADRLDRVADSLALSPDSLPQRLIATVEREWPSLGQRVQDLMDHPLPPPAEDLVLALRWLLQRALGGGSYRSTFEGMSPQQIQGYVRDILRLRTEAAVYGTVD